MEAAFAVDGLFCHSVRQSNPTGWGTIGAGVAHPAVLVPYVYKTINGELFRGGYTTLGGTFVTTPSGAATFVRTDAYAYGGDLFGL